MRHVLGVVRDEARVELDRPHPGERGGQVRWLGPGSDTGGGSGRPLAPGGPSGENVHRYGGTGVARSPCGPARARLSGCFMEPQAASPGDAAASRRVSRLSSCQVTRNDLRQSHPSGRIMSEVRGWPVSCISDPSARAATTQGHVMEPLPMKTLMLWFLALALVTYGLGYVSETALR
jgi:hypothetical protein